MEMTRNEAYAVMCSGTSHTFMFSAINRNKKTPASQGDALALLHRVRITTRDGATALESPGILVL
jgi:hypothetical protein